METLRRKQFLKSLYLPIIVTAVITIALVIVGLRDVLMAVFGICALCIFINAQIVYSVIQRNTAKAGPTLHILALCFCF
jgi:hypothetical protein